MSPKFVEFIPDQLENNIIYISNEYGTASHLCACGCGLEVVTPISPVDWKISYEQGVISLFPSIGNWDYPCKSHYWIRNNKVIWAESWSEESIELARKNDQDSTNAYYDRDEKSISSQRSKKKWWQFWKWFSKR